MIKVGDRLPAGKFLVKQADDSVKEVTTGELFKGKKVVFVGVPGAFTSTCHNAHVPAFIANARELKAKGADSIVVMAVNDHHVMKAWSESLSNKGEVDFVSDGNGEYAKALGLLVDLSGPGLGMRVRRFSALVDDGVVRTLNLESDGKNVTVTSAATMLGQL